MQNLYGGLECWPSAFSTTVERNRMYIYMLCKRPSTFVLLLKLNTNTVSFNKSEFKSVIIECCTQNKPNLTLLFSRQQNKWQRPQRHLSLCSLAQRDCVKITRNARIWRKNWIKIRGKAKKIGSSVHIFRVYLILWWQKMA